ncbi:aromatic ring-hydroxylating dioxygenase subunit alpha, partial [Pseudomonas syringae]
TRPSKGLLGGGGANAGDGGYTGRNEVKASSIVVDLVTPATDTASGYVWGMARKFEPADAELTASSSEGQGKICTEDLEMLERQQQNLLTHPHRSLLKLNIDAGGVQSRTILERLIAAEQAGRGEQIPVLATT